MSVDKVSVNIEKIQPNIDHYCSGFGCSLSVMCLRFLLWMNGRLDISPISTIAMKIKETDLFPFLNKKLWLVDYLTMMKPI